jgi:hypothetical protein
MSKPRDAKGFASRQGVPERGVESDGGPAHQWASRPSPFDNRKTQSVPYSNRPTLTGISDPGYKKAAGFARNPAALS